jgi:hypothetical protein
MAPGVCRRAAAPPILRANAGDRVLDYARLGGHPRRSAGRRPEEPQHPHVSEGIFAGSRKDTRGAQHLARRDPHRDEPRAGEGVGPIERVRMGPWFA